MISLSPAQSKKLKALINEYAGKVNVQAAQDLLAELECTIDQLMLAVVALASEFSHRLAASAATRPDCLVAMPLHPARLRERGYNQATELARPIARALNIPIDYQHCQRQRATAIQSDLPASERPRNVKGVFSVVKKIPVRHVVIVDDVMTTGATVAELATTLRNAGVERIDVWVCARAALIF